MLRMMIAILFIEYSSYISITIRITDMKQIWVGPGYQTVWLKDFL